MDWVSKAKRVNPMQVHAKLPFLVRGTPVRNNGPRDIVVSRDFAWDIPEVSSSEVELVFENLRAFKQHVSPNDPLYGARQDYSEVDSCTRVIKHDGELYRNVSSPGDDILELFRYAFPRDYDYLYVEDISLERRITNSARRFIFPASLPVFRHLLWRIECDPVGTNYKEAWPVSIKIPETEVVSGSWWKRNFISFEEVLPKLTEFKHDQMQECLRTYQGHMANFLLVDGQLWMKTRPPAYKVGRRHVDARTLLITVSLAFASDVQDRDLTNAYFSLDARDEAFEYAHCLRDIYASPDTAARQGYKSVLTSSVLDLTSNYVAHDPAAMAYDYQTEELRRISSGMAVSARYAIVKHPQWIEELGEAVVEDVHKAFAEVQVTNYVLDEYGDPSDWLASTINAWKQTGRQSASYGYGELAVSDMMIERAMRFEEDKPITVAAVASAPKI